MALAKTTFDRRAYPQQWRPASPATVLPVAGLMTGHAYINQFINTTWSPSCKTIQLPR